MRTEEISTLKIREYMWHFPNLLNIQFWWASWFTHQSDLENLPLVIGTVFLPQMVNSRPITKTFNERRKTNKSNMKQTIHEKQEMKRLQWEVAAKTCTVYAQRETEVTGLPGGLVLTSLEMLFCLPWFFFFFTWPYTEVIRISLIIVHCREPISTKCFMWSFLLILLVVEVVVVCLCACVYVLK